MLQYADSIREQIEVPQIDASGIRQINVPASVACHTPERFQRMLSTCAQQQEESCGYRFDFGNQDELHPVVLSILLCFVKKVRTNNVSTRLEFINVSDTIHAFLQSTRLIDRCRILFPET